MQTTIRALLGAALVATAFGVAVAKLPPAPPLTDEQKAEKATKDKGAADTAKEQLMKAEDKAVANYVSNQKSKGNAVNAQPASGQPSAAQPSSVQPPSAQPSSAQPPSAQPSSDQPAASDGGGKSLPAEPEKASNAHSPPTK